MQQTVLRSTSPTKPSGSNLQPYHQISLARRRGAVDCEAVSFATDATDP
jgi:hypothetical protein